MSHRSVVSEYFSPTRVGHFIYPPFASTIIPMTHTNSQDAKDGAPAGWLGPSKKSMPILVETPCVGVVGDTYSGSFDSPLLLLSLVLAQDWAGLRWVVLRAALNVINAARIYALPSRLIMMITTMKRP
jgi:hypothetical protein